MNIEIANRLVELRKKKGMSQEELAAKLGLSRQAVSKWERAEASPDTDNLICLAKLYGVSLDELLETDKTVEDIIDEAGTAEKTQEEAKAGEESKKKSKVTIGPSGIHVVDDKEEVHIGIGGIHVTDKDNNVHIGPTGIHIDDRKNSKGARLREVLTGIYSLAVAVAYVFIGVFTHMWHPFWILFLTIPVFSSIFDCFIYKKITKFAFPIVVVIAYLMIGFVWIGDWHPWWALFLTIPLFYVIFKPIERLWLKEEFTCTTEEDDDDDDDDDEKDEDDKDFNIEINGKKVKSFKVTKDGKTVEIEPETEEKK